MGELESNSNGVFAKLASSESFPSVPDLRRHRCNVELPGAGCLKMVPNVVRAGPEKGECNDKPSWAIRTLGWNTEKVKILRSLAVKPPKSRYVPLDERWRVRIKGTGEICEANKLCVVRRKPVKNLIHLRRVALAAGILANVQLAADSGNDNVEPEVLDTEPKFKGCILEARDTRLAFCVVEPGKSLPNMPCGVEETLAIDNLFRSAIRVWWNVH